LKKKKYDYRDTDNSIFYCRFSSLSKLDIIHSKPRPFYLVNNGGGIWNIIGSHNNYYSRRAVQKDKDMKKKIICSVAGCEREIEYPEAFTMCLKHKDIYLQCLEKRIPDGFEYKKF
jgi:hypothetical protein